INKIRKSKGITIQELAKVTGISIASLSMYENGKRLPSINNIKKISKGLNVDLSEFYGEPEEQLNFEEGEVLNLKLSHEVKKEVLERAAGFCELCNFPAPFKTEEGEPYLLIKKIDNEQDEKQGELDLVAVCPNCLAKLEVLNLIGDRNYLLRKLEGYKS
ncbi:helix-turn-helix domain-containing protein, partial [Bacillus cereus]|uniref:helix-turn-helix domain-containing protein n=2 Tax=Bacillus TaxID=1386 RepID=UPI003CE99F19